MTKSITTRCVLVLTIGTGHSKDLEGSLFIPLLRSVRAGTWDRVVLLPSQSTVDQARALENRISDLSVDILPIPRDGDENDADACFGHFDHVLRKLISSGIGPENITLDFTRGTKAMSAALVLAGAGWAIPVLRYIQGERSERGTVIASTEQIREIRTEIVSARQRLDLAERLLRSGNFEAVRSLLTNDTKGLACLPEALRSRFVVYRTVANVYSAWDRFDYGSAYKILKESREVTAAADAFAPTREMEEWVEKLSQRFDRSDHLVSAAHLRYLVCDILANAERRIRDGQYEDAAVRCYRVLELIGQMRLFDKGYDSGFLPSDDSRVRRFQEKLKKDRSKLFAPNPGRKSAGTLNSARDQTARFLKFLEDPLGKRLLKFGDQRKQYSINSRNNGILIHGFEAKTPEIGAKMLREDLV